MRKGKEFEMFQELFASFTYAFEETLPKNQVCREWEKRKQKDIEWREKKWQKTDGYMCTYKSGKLFRRQYCEALIF